MAVKVISLTHRPLSSHQKHYFSASGSLICYRLSEPQGPVRPEGLGKLKKKCIHLIGSRTRNLTACSLMPQPLATSWPRIRIQTRLSIPVHSWI
jgi:hypothetical protein